MQARRTAPVPEVEYFLDSAQEQAEMDACSAMTLRLYGDDVVMLPIVTQKFENYHVRREHCLTLIEMADDILVRLPEKRRAGLVHTGLRNITYEIINLAEMISSWAIDDAVEGGAFDPFRDQVRSRKGIIFKNTMRQLRSPRYARRYVKRRAGEASHLKQLAQIMVRRAAALPGPALQDQSLTHDWRAQLNWSQVRTAAVHLDAERKKRKVILRSLRAATSIVGTETVSAFLRGEEIKLIGSESILVVRKRGLLTDTGHGCLSVGLLDRSGTRLADLCTFVEDTPCLDQLSAFALWMASGEDREVIKTANVIDVTNEGRGHPLLIRPSRDLICEQAMAELIMRLGPEQADQIIAMIEGKRNPRGKVFVRQLTYEQHQARNKAYWEEMRGHYIEAMMVLVIGYRNFPIFKAAEAL